MPNEVILEQFEAMVSTYCNERVSVVMPANMPFDHKSDVYILDESDSMIESQAVFFEWNKRIMKHELRGLAAAFHAKRVYFMSATFDNYQKKLLEKVY